MTAALVCNGRAQPDGPACGRAEQPYPDEDQAGYEERARVKGWRIGPAPASPGQVRHVMCPQCGRPDPDTDRLLQALANSTRGPR